MRELVYTLLGEGPSDRRLLHPIDWVIGEATDRPFRGQWADRRGLNKVGGGLAGRVSAAVDQFPCDVLFVHRDSDARDHTPRTAEIDAAIQEVGDVLHVKVIPVRMQEAWFLFNEEAIRRAAGRPSGGEPLDLPALNAVERLADPKAKLNVAIRTASGRKGRRLRQFSTSAAAERIAELITDYSPLRELPAFQRLEGEVAAVFGSLE